MMDKKRLPHIITVTSFVVFIVLGLACTTTKSSQSGTQRGLYSANDYYKRGYENAEKGNYELAIEDFTEAIRLSPPNPAPVYNARAWTYAYYMKSNFDQAIADATQAIKLDSNKAEYYDTRGWAYLGKGDYNRAIDDFNKALRIDPSIESSKDGLRKIREAQAEEVIDWSQFE